MKHEVIELPMLICQRFGNSILLCLFFGLENENPTIFEKLNSQSEI